MKHLRWLLLLVPLIALPQSHEQVLSTLGLPMPANSVFCNSTSSPATAKTCTAGTNITISGGTIAASGAGGSSGFNAITSGTNTTAAMLVGTGGSLGPTGSGTITATSATGINGAVVPASAGALSTNSSRQFIAVTTTGTGNAVLATSPTLTTPNVGVASATSLTITGNGGASSPAAYLSGAPYTGGSATTTYPYIYCNDGTSPTSWSTSGTEFGCNAPSGFTGNFLDFHVNGGASVFSVTYQGKVAGGTYNGSTVPASAGTLVGSSGAFTVSDCLQVGSTSPLEISDGGLCTGPGGTSGQIEYNNSGVFGGVTAVTYANGGTGLTTEPTNGKLLIGNGSGYTLATITAGSGITVTNGSGSITLAASLSASSANPSAKVGPSAVNGSASTFMTSDSAPPIDLTATYPWTGPHSFASTLTLYDSASGGPFNVGYLGTPDNSQAGTGGYTLIAADRGKRITLTTAGNTITIPTAIFADGDVVTILVPQTGTETISPAAGFTLDWANGTTVSGGSGSAGNRTLTGWAAATIEFTSSSKAFIVGGGIS